MVAYSIQTPKRLKPAISRQDLITLFDLADARFMADSKQVSAVEYVYGDVSDANSILAARFRPAKHVSG